MQLNLKHSSSSVDGTDSRCDGRRDGRDDGRIDNNNLHLNPGVSAVSSTGTALIRRTLQNRNMATNLAGVHPLKLMVAGQLLSG